MSNKHHIFCSASSDRKVGGFGCSCNSIGRFERVTANAPRIYEMLKTLVSEFRGYEYNSRLEAQELIKEIEG